MTETKVLWLINAGKKKRHAANGTAHALDQDHALCTVTMARTKEKLGVKNNGVIADRITEQNSVCPNCERMMEAKGYIFRDGTWVKVFEEALQQP
jgi:hypothetical protein